jgi:hypothetical protein
MNFNRPLQINKNALNLLKWTPHPLPLPLGGEREGVRGANSNVKIVFAFVLDHL